MTDGADPAWLRAEREYEDDRFERGTIPELFEDSAERHLDGAAQLYKGGVYDRSLAGTVPRAPAGEFATLTYGELREVVRRLAAGFRALGLEPGDRVAIYADTRMEWAQVDLALLAAGCVVTTVYTDSSTDQVRYLLEDPGPKAVVAENSDLLETVRDVEDGIDIESKVLIDDPPGGVAGADAHTLGDVYQRGQEAFDSSAYRAWIEERDPEDLASVVYTSGTTGDPKGVRLTHWNFRSNVHQVRRRLGPRPDRGSADIAVGPGLRTLSFLPLAHVFERLAGHLLMFGSGATVGYAESPDTVADDIQRVRPTATTSVPRVYERILDSMREQAGDAGPKRRVFEWALDVARASQRTDDPGLLLRAKRTLADRLVYSTVRENLGGKVEFMVSGGGSLDPDLCRLFDGMGLTIIEGYGLTETAPVVSANPPEDIRPGTMGPPLVGVETRVDESQAAEGAFPDATGPVGELLVRGENVTDGYWDDPERTDAVFTDDGWFRTGDVVERTADGYLAFRERRKQLLVLSTGKNVAPGPIEDRFATSDRVEQVLVVGDGRKFVGALLVPNVERLRAWAGETGVTVPDDPERLVEDDRVREWVGEAVSAVNADLDEVERIKAFELVAETWTTDNDMLTPSMKKRRGAIEARHAEKIERIYDVGTGTDR